MAARYGPRAKGSDGSDFFHREKVSPTIVRSAFLKPKLTKVLYLQLVCAILCTVVGVLVQFDFPSLLVATGYAIGLPTCYLALQRNNSTFMNIYGVCCSLLGVFPMVYVLYTSLWSGLVTQYRYVRLFQAVVVVLVNGCGMFLAKELMGVWLQRTNTRKRD